MKGIDLSQYNTVTDYNAAKADGVEFAILKATKAKNNIEPRFEAHYNGCQAAGIKAGAYKYVYATTIEKAKAEADGVVAALNGREMPYGVWLDMEDVSLRKLDKSTITAIIDTEAKIIRAAGYAVGIYCNKDWYNNVLDRKDLTKRYLFWIAGYGKNNGLLSWAYFFTYKAMTNTIIWQYTSKGTVKGITGVVDLNINLVDDPAALLNMYGK